MDINHRYERLAIDNCEEGYVYVSPAQPSAGINAEPVVNTTVLGAEIGGQFVEPPSYSVAVELPTYDESLRAKEQEEQQLCESSSLYQPFHGASRQINAVVGTDAAFVVGFMFAFLFNWVGLIAAFCLLQSCAGRFGALSGFGLSLVKWVAIAKHHNWSVGIANENQWVWWLLLMFGITISCSSTLQYLRVKYLLSRDRNLTTASLQSL